MTEIYKNESEQLKVALFRIESLEQLEKHLTIENASLITTIESQKEEIEKAVNEIKFQVERNDRQREGYFKLEKEILSHGPEGRNYTNQQYVDLLQKFESLKAITELAVKGFEEIASNIHSSDVMAMKAKLALGRIERLQNG